VRVTHQAVCLRLQAREDAAEAGLVIVHFPDSMQTGTAEPLTSSINRARLPSALTGGSVFGIRVSGHQQVVEGWHAGVTVAVDETKSALASLLIQHQMEKLQATRLARGIIDAMGAMVSISLYPDLTRLGFSEGAVVGLDLITTIRAKCAVTAGRAGAGLAREKRIP
jgi:hypothetical protein